MIRTARWVEASPAHVQAACANGVQMCARPGFDLDHHLASFLAKACSALLTFSRKDARWFLVFVAAYWWLEALTDSKYV
jgi:hypothetical protein